MTRLGRQAVPPVARVRVSRLRWTSSIVAGLEALSGTKNDDIEVFADSLAIGSGQMMCSRHSMAAAV